MTWAAFYSSQNSKYLLVPHLFPQTQASFKPKKVYNSCLCNKLLAFISASHVIAVFVPLYSLWFVHLWKGDEEEAMEASMDKRSSHSNGGKNLNFFFFCIIRHEKIKLINKIYTSPRPMKQCECGVCHARKRLQVGFRTSRDSLIGCETLQGHRASHFVFQNSPPLVV